jgi:hypothetical protein
MTKQIQDITSAKDLLNWCDENQKKMVDLLDKVFDNTDTGDPIVQSVLKDASIILKEIEELENEINELILN